MKYAADIGSAAIIHIPGPIKIGSDIQKLVGGNSQTHRQRRYCLRFGLIF
jgi:hypothetical protein